MGSSVLHSRKGKGGRGGRTWWVLVAGEQQGPMKTWLRVGGGGHQSPANPAMAARLGAGRSSVRAWGGGGRWARGPEEEITGGGARGRRQQEIDGQLKTPRE